MSSPVGAQGRVAAVAPGPPLVRRYDSPTRGRHLRAAAPVAAGRLLWAERPLLCLQSRDNLRHAACCSHCRAFLGGPDHAMRARFRPRSRGAGSDNDDDDGGGGGAGRSTDPAPTVVPCRLRCGHDYCSPACEADAWRAQHAVLCTGRCRSAAHPLVAFKAWATATNEVLLLAAEWWVAQHLAESTEAERSGGRNEDGDGDDESWPRLRRPSDYEDFCMEPWWDVEAGPLRARPGGFVEAATLERSLREVCEEAARLLNRALEAYNANESDDDADNGGAADDRGAGTVLVPYITALDIAKRVGACAQNAMGVRQRHPLCRDVFDPSFRCRWHQEILQALEEAGFIGDDNGDCCAPEEPSVGNRQLETRDSTMSDNKSSKDDWDYSEEEIDTFLAGLFIDEDGSVRDVEQEAKGVLEERDSTGDDLDYIFPPLDGTAMYSLICKMNHACDPNVIILYKRTEYGSQHPLTAFAVALKAIDEGEELTISYIDKSETYEMRQNALANYGFPCACSKCLKDREGTNEKAKAPENSLSQIEDDLFGKDDDVDGPKEDDALVEAVADSSAAPELSQILERLESRANHCRLGSLPMKELALSSSFVFEAGKAAVSSIDNAVIIDLLGKLMDGLSSKDFCLCRIVGDDLEQLLYHQLRMEAAWPSLAYREIYWCSILGGVIGYTHDCSFLKALHLLDKGMILGLPGEEPRLYPLRAYVECHAYEMALGTCHSFACGLLPDYRERQQASILLQGALSQPIMYPIVECNRDIAQNHFHNDFVSAGKPVVIRGLASDWAAVEKWRNLHWMSSAHGHRLIPVEVGSMLAGSMQEELQCLRNFITLYMCNQKLSHTWTLDDAVDTTSKIAYIAQHPLLNQLLALKNDLDLSPALLGPHGPAHKYVWFGTGGTRTPLHFDSYDNLLVQLVGAKYIRLYDQDQTSKLYPSVKSAYGLQGNMSDIDCECEDFDRHPLAREATYTETLLLPGDCLYIPSRTWHYVRSLSSSISVNYWF